MMITVIITMIHIPITIKMKITSICTTINKKNNDNSVIVLIIVISLETIFIISNIANVTINIIIFSFLVAFVIVITVLC